MFDGRITVKLDDGRQAVIKEKWGVGCSYYCVSIQELKLKPKRVSTWYGHKIIHEETIEDVYSKWFIDSEYNIETDIPKMIDETLYDMNFGTALKRASWVWNGKTLPMDPASQLRRRLERQGLL